MKPYYCVIEDNQDENGYGDYLQQFGAESFEEASQILKANARCTHIDYWDGTRWHYYVKGRMGVKVYPLPRRGRRG